MLDRFLDGLYWLIRTSGEKGDIGEGSIEMVELETIGVGIARVACPGVNQRRGIAGSNQR